MSGDPSDPGGHMEHRRPAPEDGRRGDASTAGFFEDREGAELVRLLTRSDLPRTFERRTLVLPAGTERPTDAKQWAGTLVLVDEGQVEVDCRQGGRHTFGAGDLLVLGWLPLRTMRNPGDVDVRLVTVRRRGGPAVGLLRVMRRIRR